MTRDEIVRMAREAGGGLESDYTNISALERFAALVAAAERDQYEAKFKQLEAIMQAREQQPNKPCCLAEREACAQVCDEAHELMNSSFQGAAAAIRARSTP